MSTPSGKHVVRMGPITVLAFVIVLSLATMSVLSFATAQAASRMAEKQEVATQALYQNEIEAQSFLAQLDDELQSFRDANATSAEALSGIEGAIDGMVIDGNTIEKSFSNGTRTLKVKILLENDLSYTIDGWKTTTQLESSDKPAIWQGN